VGLCVFEFQLFKQDDWDRTPNNRVGRSSPGSWTFIHDPKVAIGTIVIAALALYGIYDSFGMSIAMWIYVAFLSIAVIAFVTERFNSRLPLAYIDAGEGGELRKMITGGVVLGGMWMLLTGLITDLFGISYIISPIIPIPWLKGPFQPMSLAIGILFIGFLAPILEEQAFRQTLAPTIAEKLGTMYGIAISGVLFGLAHFVFGGSVALAVSATGFGIILAYFTLRHQSAAFAWSAHITYNVLVIVISYIIYVVGVG
jgi:membrane protease YdiL (CAAX protease family)